MVLKESMREKLTEVEVVIPTPLYVLSISLGRHKDKTVHSQELRTIRISQQLVIVSVHGEITAIATHILVSTIDDARSDVYSDY